GDREFWISASRIGRFDLEAELGSLTPTWTIERAGQSVGPIQTAGRLAVFQHQYEEGPGVTLWGLDTTSGSVQWKTVLGAPWPLPPGPSPDGQQLTTLANDGPEVTISSDLLAKGGFLEWPLRRPGYFSLPVGPVQRLERENLTVLVPSPDADHLLVRQDKTSEFRRVDLPAPLGARPVFWGPDLFVPGLDGRAYLVNPETGSAQAEPYVPAFDTDEPTRWRAPVFLDDAVLLANQAGQVRRLARVTEPRLRLDVVGEVVDLKSTLESDPATTTDAVIVVTEDGRVRSLAGRDLSSLGAWNLEVPRALGPLALKEHAFLVDKAGGVMAFGADGDRIWATDLRDEPPVGPPVILDGEVWFLSRNGALQKRSLEDGSSLDRYDLGLLPSGGLVIVGSEVVVQAAPGTVRLLKPTDGSAGGAP
ncbi:MAG TPA: PQQ-binding-like beta-propeller repeat protein, partial [Isosphaeraceae bacterium]|nr:PQQ-binding-like beta-propeller repeat protein [Isosphaeraceae bacterium]